MSDNPRNYISAADKVLAVNHEMNTLIRQHHLTILKAMGSKSAFMERLRKNVYVFSVL